MDPTTVVVLGALAVVASLFRRLRRAPGDAMEPVPREPSALDPHLVARLQGISPDGHLRVEPYRDDRGENGACIVVAGVCDRLSLQKERLDFSPPPPRAPDLDTEDEEFDAQFHVLGPRPLVHAILGAGTRRALRTLLFKPSGVADLSVGGGELRVDVLSPTAFSLERMEQLARAVIALAHRLVTPADVAARLAHNAHKDPLPQVRLRQLATLLHEYPESPATREALGLAAADPDPEVRLHAGVGLGEAGTDVLLALAGDEGVDESCASRAIDALGGGLEPERARPILDSALRLRGGPGAFGVERPRVVHACLGALARGRRPGAAPVLGQVLLSRDESLGVEAAKALAALGLPEAEVTLLEGLQAQEAQVRLASAKCLGGIGSVAAVGPLEAAADRLGGSFRQTALEAVAEIQGRLTGAAPGQVSLAEGSAGELSLTDDTGGRVSLVASRGNGTTDEG